MGLLTKIPTQDFGKVRIALGCEHGDGVSGCPKQKTRKPHSQTQAEGRCDRSIDDGKRAGHTAEQDRFGQGAVQRHLEALDHETSAPPPNEKNDRKKLDAANAMDRPKTIWIRRRNPPEVSPKASVKPVMI